MLGFALALFLWLAFSALSCVDAFWICFIDIVQFSVCTDKIIAFYTSILCLLSWTHSVAFFALQSLYSFQSISSCASFFIRLTGKCKHNESSKNKRERRTTEWGKEEKKNKYVDNKSWQEKIFGNDDKRNDDDFDVDL